MPCSSEIHLNFRIFTICFTLNSMFRKLHQIFLCLDWLFHDLSQLIGMNKTIQNALIACRQTFEIMDLERKKPQKRLNYSRV